MKQPLNVFIYPYHEASKGMRTLAIELKTKCIRLEDTKFEPGFDKLIINWGNTNYDKLKAYQDNGCKIINFGVYNLASRKSSYDFMYGKRVNIPEYTTNSRTAQAWINNGKLVVGRFNQSDYYRTFTKVILSDNQEPEENGPSEFKKSELFTQYIPKASEFRVHFFNNNVVYTEQRLLRDTDDNKIPVNRASINWKIRNHENGFMLDTPVIKVPNVVYEQSETANRVCGLDFCAFDVLYSKSQNKAYVLEANPRPQLSEKLKHVYIQQLKGIIE